MWGLTGFPGLWGFFCFAAIILSILYGIVIVWCSILLFAEKLYEMSKWQWKEWRRFWIWMAVLAAHVLMFALIGFWGVFVMNGEYFLLLLWGKFFMEKKTYAEKIVWPYPGSDLEKHIEEYRLSNERKKLHKGARIG
jgi:hypothetical protein